MATGNQHRDGNQSDHFDDNDSDILDRILKQNFGNSPSCCSDSCSECCSDTSDSGSEDDSESSSDSAGWVFLPVTDQD